MSKTSVLLIASQIPQQELGLVAHVLQSQGFRQTPASERPKGSVVLCFETPDKENTVAIKFYQEIGARRLELTGDISKKIGVALGQYMEPLTPEKLGEFYDMSQSDMERRIYAILLVLAYPDATSAMSELRDKYFASANDATREGIVHGLEFIETPDAGAALEQIERVCKGQELATMARHAIDSLSERGLIRESTSSFKDKVEAMIYEHPADALDLIEKYEEGGAAPEIRALHARALRLVGRMAVVAGDVPCAQPERDRSGLAAESYLDLAVTGNEKPVSGFYESPEDCLLRAELGIALRAEYPVEISRYPERFCFGYDVRLVCAARGIDDRAVSQRRKKFIRSGDYVP